MIHKCFWELSLFFFFLENELKKYTKQTSLVVERIRLCLPVQGTWVQSLVQEGFTFQGVLNLCAVTLKPMSLEPVFHNKRSHCNEKPTHHKEEFSLLFTTRESLLSNEDPV